ncbi:MAG TPA: TIGR02757 family protein, partial [Bacteroidales bacterium]|nr:TIGR02757 family protein [Bacteroidales bacterium]
TFNDSDCLFFLDALRYLYREQGGLEGAFGSIPEKGIREGILDFRRIFLSRSHLKRTEKHLSDPAQGSSSKRFHLFLRWMVRKDDRGVDFGLWRRISPSVLLCPLDVHAGKAARMLGLLQRKNNDWKAAEELTASLRMFDPIDPVKYDFALFGLGAMGDPTDRNE